MSHRCDVPRLVKNTRVRVPTIWHVNKDSRTHTSTFCHNTANSTSMEKQSWFSNIRQLSVKHPLCLPAHLDLLSQNWMSILHQNLQSLHLYAWWLSAYHCMTRCSQGVAEESLVHRQSPWAIYQSRWCYVTVLCPSLCSISCRFLVHLFRDISPSISAIKDYTAAIATTLEQPFYHAIGHSSELSKLIIILVRMLWVRSLVPQCNLCFIMDALMKALFEPMSQTDCKFVTLTIEF